MFCEKETLQVLKEKKAGASLELQKQKNKRNKRGTIEKLHDGS